MHGELPSGSVNLTLEAEDCCQMRASAFCIYEIWKLFGTQLCRSCCSFLCFFYLSVFQPECELEQKHILVLAEHVQYECLHTSTSVFGSPYQVVLAALLRSDFGLIHGKRLSALLFFCGQICWPTFTKPANAIANVTKLQKMQISRRKECGSSFPSVFSERLSRKAEGCACAVCLV